MRPVVRACFGGRVEGRGRLLVDPPFLLWLLGLPRWVRLRRYPLTLLGALGALGLAAAAVFGPGPLATFEPSARGFGAAAMAWVWLATPLSFLPWSPARLRARVGTTVEPEALFAAVSPESAEAVAAESAALAKVERAVADSAGLRALRDAAR